MKKIVQKRRIRLTPYLFILPALAIHLALVTAPSFSTLVMSFYDWNGLGGAKFIGFDNFVEIFTKDPVVFTAIINNLKWLAIFITIPIIMGFIAAMLVSRVKRGQMLFRIAFFLPYVLPSAVVAKIWTAYFNPYYGINVIFEKLGWTELANTLWIGDPNIALYSIAFVDNWHFWGFVMVMMLGALQQIDPTLYEAARVDGTSRWQEIWHISLPGIRSTVAFMIIMTVIWSFLSFDYVFVMTNGGPANSTEVLGTWIYKNAFTKYRAGYANALCVVQSGICVLFYFIQRTASKKGGLEES